MLMATLFGLFPFLTKLYADGGYQGPVFQEAMQSIMSQVNVEIVKPKSGSWVLRAPVGLRVIQPMAVGPLSCMRLGGTNWRPRRYLTMA
jgi:hypothetical protein